MFGCEKTQISVILKSKERIEELYEANASGQRCQTGKRFRESKFSELNEALYRWYPLAVSKNIFPDGTQLSEKAREIANRLSLGDFKASNGWLDRWKKKYNLRKMTVSGESGDVSGLTVDSWKERLPEMVQGYSSEDVWNLDESGVFWKALPDKGFGQKVKECKGGKKDKQRFTVAFIVNGAGKSETKPIIIWKSENPRCFKGIKKSELPVDYPRCFKGIKKSELPVDYYSQPKAWMSGDILHKVLLKIDKQLKSKGRSVILFMDNAGCHPPDIKEKYNNIKIIFLPPNTTSVLQPLDHGIIKNFKVYYRKLLMTFILAKIDTCSSASEVLKSVSVLHAIRWVAEAWKNVSEVTIKKCFRKAGILHYDFSVVSPLIPTGTDPFSDIDTCDLDETDYASSEELEGLIQQVQWSGNVCSVSELLAAEYEIPICSEFSHNTWEEEFMAELGPQTKEVCEHDDECDQDELEDMEPPPPRLKNLSEVMTCLEDVRSFLELNGHIAEATKTEDLVNTVAWLRCSTTKCTVQSTLTQYF